MVFVSVAVAAAFALYLWLLGHWFGRVLAFLAITAALDFFFMVLPAAHLSAITEFSALIAGGVIAWFVAAIPAKRAAIPAQREAAIRARKLELLMPLNRG